MTWPRLLLLWTTLLALAFAPTSATARSGVIAKTHVGVIDVAANLCIEAAGSASLGEYRENPLAEYDGTSDVPHVAGGGGTKAGVKAGSADVAKAGKAFPNSVKEQARRESGGKCVFCGTKTERAPGPKRSEIDHAIPKSRGGDNTINNAQNTCRTCNRRKGARTTEEFVK